jgi:hypothetical protein
MHEGKLEDKFECPLVCKAEGEVGLGHYLYWIALSVLNCSFCRFNEGHHLLLFQCYYRRNPKLN